MADVTVAQFAEVLKVPVDKLLTQLDQAGIKVSGPEDRISDEAKLELLSHLRRSHGGAPEAASDGPGTYELLAIISHMGSNTSCGHYVCHVRKQGRWVLYNDQKVAVSEEPPLALGYMYLYKRMDV